MLIYERVEKINSIKSVITIEEKKLIQREDTHHEIFDIIHQ